jgi:hypothetical protein
VQLTTARVVVRASDQRGSTSDLGKSPTPSPDGSYQHHLQSGQTTNTEVAGQTLEVCEIGPYVRIPWTKPMKGNVIIQEFATTYVGTYCKTPTTVFTWILVYA